MNVSLLIEIDGLMPGDFPIFEEKVTEALERMKIAGGDILNFSPIQDAIHLTSTRHSRILLVDEKMRKINVVPFAVSCRDMS